MNAGKSARRAHSLRSAVMTPSTPPPALLSEPPLSSAETALDCSSA